MAEVPDDVVVAVTRLYVRQSRLIDEGDATGWAATFTPDGVFDSPSYPAPVRGTAALVAFAADFRDGCVATRTRLRHVVTNVDVLPGVGTDRARAHVYLQIVATPESAESRLIRLTVLTDDLVRTDGAWRVARRQVRRDDGTPMPVPNDQSEQTDTVQQGASA